MQDVLCMGGGMEEEKISGGVLFLKIELKQRCNKHMCRRWDEEEEGEWVERLCNS